MDSLVKFFSKTAVSAARSLLLSEVKGGVKSLINKKRAKTIADIHAESTSRLGYITEHLAINQKTQDLSFKSSAVFVHEWLISSPLIQEQILRDEETGHIYVDGKLLSNAKKIDLINKFIGATGIKLASVSSHFDNAFKLLDLTDITAEKFKEKFAGWEPGRESIIDSWIDNCFGPILVSEQAHARMLFRKWIIGTVKRAINPGCSFDGCLTLASAFGGIGKTLHFRNLLPEPFTARTGEILCSVKSPNKFVESIKGKTIACFDELSVLEHKSSEETFKQLLSSQAIDVRLAWSREPRRYALRQGFCATTNKSKFITDIPLSRRLWVIELNGNGRLNFDYLFANRENLWKEAVYLAQNGEGCNLSIAEQAVLEKQNRKFVI